MPQPRAARAMEPHPRRGGVRRGDLCRRSLGRERPLGELRDRGGDVGDPAGTAFTPSASVKFEGGYHATLTLLAHGGSGIATLGIPRHAGRARVLRRAHPLPALQRSRRRGSLFAARGDEIAAVIVEPVAGNMGVIPPELRVPGAPAEGHRPPWRAPHLRRSDHRIPGGPRRRLGAVWRDPGPDDSGKVIGGGFLAAYGGKAEIMARMAPSGPVTRRARSSETRWPWPPGLETLRALQRPGSTRELEQKGEELQAGLEAAAARVASAGPRESRGLDDDDLLHRGPLRDYAAARRSDTALRGVLPGDAGTRGSTWRRRSSRPRSSRKRILPATSPPRSQPRRPSGRWPPLDEPSSDQRASAGYETTRLTL